MFIPISPFLNPKWWRINVVQRPLIPATIKSKILNDDVYWDLVLGEIVHYNIIHYIIEAMPYQNFRLVQTFIHGNRTL